MCEALGDYEGSFSIGGRLITNFRFADDVVVNAEEEEEAGVLVDRLDTTTTKYKMEIGPDKTKVMTNKLMRTLILSNFLYACESRTLTAEIERRIQALEVRCYRRLLNISYKDHATNEEISNRMQLECMMIS